MTTSHSNTMDFPLPIRSVTAVDYFTPLHVDTNIEYTLDMEKFPELNDPLHHWQSALLVGSHNLPSVLSLARSETSFSYDVTLSENHEELLSLIDTYVIGDLQEGDLESAFEDLAPSCPDSVLDSTGDYLESSFTSDFELSDNSVQFTTKADDSGFVSDIEEDYDQQSIPGEITQGCKRSKRKRCVSARFANTDITSTVCKRGKYKISGWSNGIH